MNILFKIALLIEATSSPRETAQVNNPQGTIDRRTLK